MALSDKQIEIIKELKILIRTPEFQDKVRRNIAAENARFEKSKYTRRPSRRQMEEVFDI